jgi:phospholipid/cholesterol/gamma-HCH transport system substrate-binding protein
VNSRRMLRIQLTIFAVIAAVALSYTAFSVLGVSLGSTTYTVTVNLPTAGGVFEGSEVTYRGVHAGEVSEIVTTRTGVVLRLTLRDDVKIPDSATATVHDLSVAGEQYVDLSAAEDSAEHLHDRSSIPASRTSTPVPFSNVLYDLQRWVGGLDPDDLRTLSRELGIAFTDTGPELRQILASSSSLVEQLSEAQPAFLHLLENSSVLLRTAAAHTGDLARFSRSLRALSVTVRASTPTVTRLLHQGADSAELIDTIIEDNASAAAVLMGNLATFSAIQVANVPGLKALLVAIPELGRRLPMVVRDGELQAGALFDYGSPVCTTGVPLTSPLSGTRTPVKKVTCRRGVARTTAPDLQSGATSARSTGTGAAQVGGIDPSGTALTADGTAVTFGWNGGQEAALGEDAWQSLLDPTSGGAP